MITMEINKMKMMIIIIKMIIMINKVNSKLTKKKKMKKVKLSFQKIKKNYKINYNFKIILLSFTIFLKDKKKN